MIRFLFKTCILLCLLFIVLSFFLPSPKNGAGDSSGQSAGLFATAAAIGTFIADMDGFCSRHPQSCDTGKSLFGTMADKAQAGAVFAYQWFGSSLHKGAENTEQHLKQADSAQDSKEMHAGSAAAESDDKTIESLIAQAPPPSPAPIKAEPALAPAKTEKPAPTADVQKPKSAAAVKQKHMPRRPPAKAEKVIFLKQPRLLDKQKTKPEKSASAKTARRNARQISAH